MSQPASNPLSAVEPWNLVADGYAETTMLVFEQFADEAIHAGESGTLQTEDGRSRGPQRGNTLDNKRFSGHRHSRILEKALAGKPEILTSDAWLGIGRK